MLAAARLVSLVGPGGVGKTRLAGRLATDLARGFADGGWWVSLAEVRQPGQVAAALMTGLDVHDQEGTDPAQLLMSRLADSALLLVLDNCEHLLSAAAAMVDDILRAAPQVRVIVTSREPLQVSGEYVLPVPPLGLPPAHGGLSLDQLQQNEAVSLFVERARSATGVFELTSLNHSAVAEVCRRLDGLPLAIELAAVRTRVLSPEQILARLSDRFALLTGGARAALPRQQTLRTTMLNARVLDLAMIVLSRSKNAAGRPADRRPSPAVTGEGTGDVPTCGPVLPAMWRSSRPGDPRTGQCTNPVQTRGPAQGRRPGRVTFASTGWRGIVGPEVKTAVLVRCLSGAAHAPVSSVRRIPPNRRTRFGSAPRCRTPAALGSPQPGAAPVPPLPDSSAVLRVGAAGRSQTNRQWRATFRPQVLGSARRPQVVRRTSSPARTPPRLDA